MWSSLTPGQRHVLLGGRTIWIAVDATGRLVQFAVPASAEPRNVATTPEQRLRLQHVPQVQHLMEQWRHQCTLAGTELPGDAEDHLHGLVRDARRHGLDGEDLQAYVFIALHLHPGFADEPPIRAVLADALATPDTLAQTLPAALQEHGLMARYARQNAPSHRPDIT